MSISASLANALTGLTAASRAAQLVSSNVANAMTEGYARRELDLSAQVTAGAGAGVQIDGIRRIVDETILRDRRLSDAALGLAKADSDFFERALDLLGKPGDAASLGTRMSGFETVLIEAASRPDSEPRLAAVLDAAQSIVRGLNEISDGVQRLREDADAAIGAEVSRLNTVLQQISDVNNLIQRNKASGRDYPALLDQRQALVDDISSIIPVRQVSRENDTIALYSMTGALLLDVEPAQIGFFSTVPIMADMTLASGALSGLTINGDPVGIAGESAPIAGGSLAGLFSVRDERALEFQAGLDGLAAELISRFEDPMLDTTLAVGDPGLFTDSGGALDPADTVGLAGRIAVNAAVNPAEGGALWRLRDGIGATIEGPPGDATLLNALSERLRSTTVPSYGPFGGGARDLVSLTADLTSGIGQSLVASGRQLSFEQARYEALRNAEIANGVDTDQEMQKLLLIEQAYAANAKVIQTVDRLIQSLLEI